MVKRLLDILLALIGLLLSIPLLPLVAILIKLDSKGRIFYTCERIGKGGRPFRMYKFRTMIDIPLRAAPSVSPRGDVRVTSFGRFLRRTKINELPQLLNILKGDMSFVGPRPEAPDLAALYPAEAKILFSVKPGLVGPAQIRNRNEEDLYPDGVDPENYYIQRILPEKLDVDLEYVRTPTVLRYLKYVVLAIKETTWGAVGRRDLIENRAQICLFLCDLVVACGSYVAATSLRFDGQVPAHERPVLIRTFPVLLCYRVACMIASGSYGTLLRYMSLSSYLAVIKAVILGALFTAATVYGLAYHMPRSVLVIDCLVAIMLMVALRATGYVLVMRKSEGSAEARQRVLIFGAGDRGHLAVLHLEDTCQIIGFLDDDRRKRHKKVQHYPVLGNRYDIGTLAELYRVDRVIIAIRRMSDPDVDEIACLCAKAGIACGSFAILGDSCAERRRAEYLESKRICHWLGDSLTGEDPSRAIDITAGKELALVGGANELRLELLKLWSSRGGAEVLIVDRYEAYLSEIVARASAVKPMARLTPCLSHGPLPVTLDAALRSKQSLGVLVHMATRKYMSRMQLDPIVIVRDNILNTWDILETAKRVGCPVVVMVSCVRAARPTSFMHKSLRLAEVYAQVGAADSGVRLAIVRLFDLFENQGGLLDSIQQQLRQGDTIMLDQADEQHYFLSARTGARVLLRAAALPLPTTSGIYVPLVGRRVTVAQLAHRILDGYGVRRKRDSIIQLKVGETQLDVKEEILSDSDALVATEDVMIGQIRPPTRRLPLDKVVADIDDFRYLVAKQDRNELIHKLDSTLNAIDRRCQAAAG